MPSRTYSLAPGLALAAALLFCSSAALPQQKEKPLPLRDLLGAWTNTVDGSRVLIRNPDGKPSQTDIEIVGKGGRLWKGHFLGTKFVVLRTPAPEEMNPAVPEWARKSVAGKLQWRVELQAKLDEDDYYLDGTLVPGEINWSETKDLDTGEVTRHDAWLSNAPGSQGAPIPLHYTKSQDWAIADTLVTGSVPTRDGKSRNYYLFAYGPHLPSRWPTAKQPAGTDRNIEYRVEAAANDIETGHASYEADRQWKNGWKRLKADISPKDADRLKSWNALLIRARLGTDVLPGRKEFWLGGSRYKNGDVESGWFLDEGTAHAVIRMMRPIPSDASPQPGGAQNNQNKSELPRPTPGFEATPYVYFGEMVRAEVQTDPPVDLPSVSVLLGSGGAWYADGTGILASAFRVEGMPGVYRTTPIRVLPMYHDQGVHTQNSSLILLSVDTGHELQARLADPKQFVIKEPQTSAVADVPPPESLWIDALRKAATCAGITDIPDDAWIKLPNKTATVVENRVWTEAIFKIGLAAGSTPLSRYLEKKYGVRLGNGTVEVKDKITIADHAATLLLRDEFVSLMEELLGKLNVLDTPEKQLAFMNSLKDGMRDERFAPRNLMVHGPIHDYVFRDGKQVGLRKEYQLKLFYPGGFIHDRPVEKLNISDAAPGYWTHVHTEADRAKVIRDALLEGFAEYKRYAEASLAKASRIGASDVQGLLELTGQGFNAVVASLVPKLMRPNKSGDGLTWEPDVSARIAVQNVYQTWDLIRARKQWSQADTAESLVLASFIPYLLPATALRIGVLVFNVLSTAYNTYEAVSEQGKQNEERAFALGASKVLGSQRFNMAAAQDSPMWGAALNLALFGFGLNKDVKLLMAELSEMEAIPLADVVAERTIQKGPQALAESSPKEQAAFLAAATTEELARPAGAGMPQAGAAGRIAKAGAIIEKEAAAIVEKQAAAAPSATKPLTELEFVPVKARTASTNPLPPLPEPVPVAVAESPNTITVTFEGSKGQKYRVTCELMDQGKMFAVYRLEAGKRVFKLCKYIDAEGQAILKGVQTGQEILDSAGIYVLKLEDAGQAGSRYYYVQEHLPQYAKKVRDFLTDGYKLPADARESMEELLGTMFKKNICFEDCHVDNLFINRPPGTAARAGIMDPDRIAYWNKLTPELEMQVKGMEAIPRRFVAYPSTDVPIRSMVGANSKQLVAAPGRRTIDLETYWLATLERHGYVKFENGKFVDGILSVEGLHNAGFQSIKTRGVYNVNPVAPVPPPLKRGGAIPFRWPHVGRALQPVFALG